MVRLQLDEEAIFKVAVEITRPETRADYLDQVCAGNAALLHRVTMLLDAHLKSPNYLESPPPGIAVTLDSSSKGVACHQGDASRFAGTYRVGAQIGPYKIREQLAEGGMGVVYVAEQIEPVHRKVALKIIKPGMATREVIARFEAERQALAMMEHPHIARIIDAGTTEFGQPFFVMELVYGVPITQYCDEHEMPTRERLQLFAKVCRAVQHAHQKGVIHRDIKPSNVLVADIDGRAVPKVIDFGVAKAVSTKLSDQTVYTQFSQMVGTPLYMSPEQANLGVQDIDTRSDGYSLGVLLYELLTGRTPFERDTLKKLGIDELRRVIREDEPPRPSVMVSTLQGQALSTVAAGRHIDPRKFSHSMRGELDWIVMKALEKDRERRYETASAFAADIQRFLNGEAVQACPPSALYRFRKFTRRYRAAITTAALLAAALIVGIVGTTWQMLRAIDAEQNAQAAVTRAESEASIAKAVNDFLQEDLLSQADPTKAATPDPNVRLRDVVDRAATSVSDRFQDQPLVKAAIHQTLGETYQSLGEYRLAEENAQRSVAIRQAELGEAHEDTLDSISTLSSAISSQGRYAEAETMNRKSLRISRQALGDEHFQTITALGNVAANVGMQERYAEAESMLREQLEVQRRVLGDEHSDTLLAKTNLAVVMINLHRYAEAESLIGEVLEVRRRVEGDEHPNTLSARGLAANLMSRQGRAGEAESLLRDVLEVKRRVLGDEHPETLEGMSELALAIYQQGRFAEAEAMSGEVLEVQRRVLGEEHPLTLSTLVNLATVKRKQDRHAEATKMMREVLEDRRRVLGEEHPLTLQTMGNVAVSLADQGQYQEAVALQREVLEARQRVVGDDHADTRLALQSLAAILLGQSWKLATDADASLRDPQQAVELAREVVKLQPEKDSRWNKLGVALYSSGQWQESVAAFEKADGLIGGDHKKYSMFRVMAYWRIGDKERARELYAEAAAWIEAGPQNIEEQKRFREEAEQLLGVTEMDRKELVAEYYSQLDRTDVQALTERAKWYQSQNKDEAAIEDLTAAIELKSDHTLLYLRGISYTNLNQDQNALADFCKLIELDLTSEVRSIRERGRIYHRQGKLDLALADLTMCIELRPTQTFHRQNFLYRASIYRELEKYDLALADCQQGIEINPLTDAPSFTRQAAYELRGDIYADNLQQYAKAIAEYDQAIELDPENAIYYEKRAAAVQALEQCQPVPPAPAETL